MDIKFFLHVVLYFPRTSKGSMGSWGGVMEEAPVSGEGAFHEFPWDNGGPQVVVLCRFSSPNSKLSSVVLIEPRPLPWFDTILFQREGPSSDETQV